MISAASVRSHSRAASRARAVSVVAVLCALALAWGWSVRDEIYLTPESGLGYGLGVAGTAMMLLLLGYSLRKRVRLMRSWGPIRSWFVVHMMLGLLGPAAILFHCKFQLGSLNSSVALLCALTVSGSGVVGRVLYPKIHHGLTGRRATLEEYRRELDSQRSGIGAAAGGAPEVTEPLRSFESFALAQGIGPWRGMWRFLRLGRRARATRREALRALSRSGSRDAQPTRAAERAVQAYVDGVCRVAQFRSYERLFSLWHAAHLPLCFTLFAAAAVHVVAVHMY